MRHPLRFGVITIQNTTWNTLVKRWHFIERVGFDIIWVADHFVNFCRPQDLWFESWTLLAGLASQTSKIQIGTLITAFPFRNPAFLARQALTVDHISNGRLVLGLGAGVWGDPSYEMIGIPNWSPRERVARFREYIEIVDQLLTNEITTYDGHYYTLKDAIMSPRPVQNPRPPLLIAAGRKTMLKYVAQYADTWNDIGGILEEDVEAVRRKNQLLDKYCSDLGRDPKTLQRSYWLCENKWADFPFLMDIYKSTDTFLKAIEQFLDAGITEFILGYPFINKQVPIFEQIAKEIIPELRKCYT